MLLSKVVKAKVYDSTHLLDSEGEVHIVDDNFHMTKKGWWYFELIGSGPRYTIGRVITAEK